MNVVMPLSKNDPIRLVNGPGFQRDRTEKRAVMDDVSTFMVHPYRLDTVTIEPERHRITSLTNGLHRLSYRQIAGLALLAANYGHVVSRADLHKLLCQTPYGLREKSALAQHIRRIRRALGDEVSNPRFIETVRDSGFILLMQPRFVEAT